VVNVSPRTADPAVRSALIEAAASLVVREGSDALTLRRLAAEVGTSTMAIYTHFGGMDQLRRAVRREAFARLAARLDEVEHTRDPVADMLMFGWAYYTNAADNPDLYRVMFMEQPVDAEDAVVGLDTFERLIAAVDRCLQAGRFTSGDATTLATQLWAAEHGVVSLFLAAIVSRIEALDTILGTVVNLFKAYGDNQRAISRSLAAARRRSPELDALLAASPGPGLGAALRRTRAAG
jgi:AcrR family transcriptional regulator